MFKQKKQLKSSQGKRIAIVAAEASGDLLAAGLVNALKKYDPSLQFEGVTGPLMEKAGVHSIETINALSVMGIVEVLKRLPQLLRLRYRIKRYFLKDPPDLFIGVDAPDFNLPIEKALKAAGVPVVHYVSPSVWAWREKRIYKIKQAVDLMLTLFPFEVAVYQRHQVPVSCVGHPLADRKIHFEKRAVLRKKYGILDEAPVLALLPGSRKAELTQLAQIFVDTAVQLREKIPHLHCVAPMANADRLTEFANYLPEHSKLPVSLLLQETQTALLMADVVLVASGTATLEVLLHERPMVVAYKMPALNYWIAKRFVKIRTIALPNLLADEIIVPEYLQDRCTVKNLSQALYDIFQQSRRFVKGITVYQQLKRQLTQQADQRAAEAIWQHFF